MGTSSSKKVITASTGLMHCTLWKIDRSPACRAVMMALDAMNLSINEVDVNLDSGEHREPEFSAVNPLHTVPIFKDRELVLIDSHAITTYLASRYYNYGLLLPKDPSGRASNDLLMHYDSSILYPRYRAAAYPIICGSNKMVTPRQSCDIELAYCDLEFMLVGRQWLGGSCPTLGDITIAATVSSLNVLVPIDQQRFPRLSCWLNLISEELYYITANKKGLCEFSNRLIGESDCCTVIPKNCPRSSQMRRASATE